jgi:hypothetical protein
VETIVILKLLAGRMQERADIEAIVASGTDRELLHDTVRRVLPDRPDTLERLYENVDRTR